MEFEFKINKNEVETISELRNLLEIVGEEDEDGFDSGDIVILIAAAIPSVCDVIKKYINTTSVTITYHTKDGRTIQISSTSAKKAQKQLKAICEDMGWETNE